MKTVLTESATEAAGFIRAGGIAAFPTETVYGLGANIFNKSAIAKVFKAKGRPSDNPLIAHISDISQITELASEITDSAEAFIERLFPGPLTIVLAKNPAVPLVATAGLYTIGIRMPDHLLTRHFIEACETPVVAPSANISGRPSPTTYESVIEDLDGRIDCVLLGATTRIGIESTVVDCTGEFPVVLRSGAVTIEELQSIVPETRFAAGESNEPARSPGVKHRHYSPKAKVILVKGLEKDLPLGNSAFIGINAPHQEHDHELISGTIENYAHSLYEFFRECDRKGISVIYCEEVAESGIGMALMDRIRRAARG